MMKTKGKTLKELDVQPGDVVQWEGGGKFTVMSDYRLYSHQTQMNIHYGDNWKRGLFTLVSRANPTRAQLDAQIAELTAQRDAMPEVVRVYAWTSYYRDFEMIDGVPEGFKEVGK